MKPGGSSTKIRLRLKLTAFINAAINSWQHPDNAFERFMFEKYTFIRHPQVAKPTIFIMIFCQHMIHHNCCQMSISFCSSMLCRFSAIDLVRIDHTFSWTDMFKSFCIGYICWGDRNLIDQSDCIPTAVCCLQPYQYLFFPLRPILSLLAALSDPRC